MNTKQDQTKPLEVSATWQTQARGSNQDEYEIYLACADNGKGRHNTQWRTIGNLRRVD